MIAAWRPATASTPRSIVPALSSPRSWFGSQCDHSDVTTNLGEGWTIERVRTHSGDATAEELSLDRRTYLDDGHDLVTLTPRAIVKVGGLILVWHDEDWYMGELDDDGAVVCWSAYASDLGGAINAM